MTFRYEWQMLDHYREYARTVGDIGYLYIAHFKIKCSKTKRVYQISCYDPIREETLILVVWYNPKSGRAVHTERVTPGYQDKLVVIITQ